MPPWGNLALRSGDLGYGGKRRCAGLSNCVRPSARHIVTWGPRCAGRDGLTRRLWNCARRAAELLPDNAEIHFMLGQALKKAGKNDEAVQESLLFQQRSKKAADRDLVNSYVAEGTKLLQAGQVEEAITKLQQALRLDPENASASYNYGLALLFQNKPEEAITRFQVALQSQPDNPEMLYFLARAYLAANRPEDAAACFRKLMVMRPDDPFVHNGLGVALAKTQDLPNATAEFKNALRLAPTNALIQKNQACIENHLQGCELTP